LPPSNIAAETPAKNKDAHEQLKHGSNFAAIIPLASSRHPMQYRQPPSLFSANLPSATQARFEAGLLTCEVEAGVAFIMSSPRDLHCVFH
jgi:hypothetical protein